MSNLITEVAKSIAQNHSLGLRGDVLTINGRKQTPTETTILIKKDKITEKMPDEALKAELMSFLYESSVSERNHGLGEPVIDLLVKKLKQKEKREFEEKVGAKTGGAPIGNFTFENKCPLYDLGSGEKYIYDLKNRCVTSIDYKIFMELLPKNVQGLMQDAKKSGFVQYHPFDSRGFWQGEYLGDEVTIFNSYNPPPHVFAERMEKVDLFHEFMAHLFPEEDSRNYVFNWMWNMVKSRNQTVLLLNGQKGIGKGVFADICRHLVGESNYQLMGEGFFRSQFNAESENKRLIYIDEVPLRDRYTDKIKSMCNDTIQIEKKGKDVSGQIPNYASFILSNNYIYENYLDQGDRRISVPEITDIKTEKVFTVEQMDKFVEQYRSPEGLKWIISQLKQKRSKQTVWAVWKGEKFWELCFEGMEEWKKYIITHCEDKGKDIKYIDLKEDFADFTGFKTMPGLAKIGEFLNNFRDRDGDLYAKAVKDPDGNRIIMLPKYCKEKDKFEEEIEV